MKVRLVEREMLETNLGDTLAAVQAWRQASHRLISNSALTSLLTAFKASAEDHSDSVWGAVTFNVAETKVWKLQTRLQKEFPEILLIKPEAGMGFTLD